LFAADCDNEYRVPVIWRGEKVLNSNYQIRYMKKITIATEAYKLLLANKLKGESFSEEIARVVSTRRRKKLSDFFGILTEKGGSKMHEDLKRIRKMNIELLDKRLKSFEITKG
jgi:predicted CopG family antitoxin